MARIQRFEDLQAWKIAREVNREIYRVTRGEHFSRDWGLRDQIRRSSVSILSNIAEGFERDGDKEFLQFLSVAKGSAGEARAQLYVALDLNYISSAEFEAICEKLIEVSRILSGLSKYLRQSDLKGRKFA